MSLALFQERIEQSVAGALSPEEEALVRAHLRTCDACRAHHDALKLVARALGDSGAQSERDRLFAALEKPQRKLGRWVALAAAAAALAAIAVVTTREPETRFRGGDDAAHPAFSLRLYGKPTTDASVALLADFPGAAEARVGAASTLQLFVKPGPPLGAGMLVEVIGSAGRVRFSTFGAVDAGNAPLAVGNSFDAATLGIGTARACAVSFRGPEGGASLEELARREHVSPVCGTIRVEP